MRGGLPVTFFISFWKRSVLMEENGEFWLMEGERKAFGINKHKSGWLCLGFKSIFKKYSGEVWFVWLRGWEMGENNVDDGGWIR